MTPPPPLQWLLLREPRAWPSWLLWASPRGAPGPRQLSVQLAMPGAPPCRPAQPHLCPIEASSMDSAIPAGQPQLHVKFLPAFLGWGEGFGLPKRGHLCQHADSWGWRIPEAVPRARPAFPVAWRAPRPAVTHPAQQESGRNVPCALPWIPGPPAPSGRAHGGPRWHMSLVVWGSCLSAVGAVGGWVAGTEGLGPADEAAEGVRSRPFPSVGVLVCQLGVTRGICRAGLGPTVRAVTAGTWQAPRRGGALHLT